MRRITFHEIGSLTIPEIGSLHKVTFPEIG